MAGRHILELRRQGGRLRKRRHAGRDRGERDQQCRGEPAPPARASRVAAVADEIVGVCECHIIIMYRQSRVYSH